MKHLLVAFLLLTGNYCVAASSCINSKNWMTHPETKVIRSLYNNIEQTIKKGGLKKIPLPDECGGDVEEEGASVQATLYETSAGLVRKYKLSGGTGDSAADAAYYYDKAGKLRFVFQSLRAVNGAEMETRTYFDENGKNLYRDDRLKKGSGWAGGFPETIPDPKEHFNSLCK